MKFSTQIKLIVGIVVVIGIMASAWLMTVLNRQGGGGAANIDQSDVLMLSPAPTTTQLFSTTRARTESRSREHEYRDVTSALTAPAPAERLILYKQEVTDEIGDIESLKELVVRSTPSTTLPDSIGGLQRLEILNLARNPELTQLPSTIGNLVSLEQLNIVDTGIVELPAEIADLRRLRIIFVAVDQLSSEQLNTVRILLPNVNVLEQ